MYSEIWERKIGKIARHLYLCLNWSPRISGLHSPLHIGAKFGLELFKEMAMKFKNINAANNNGETPLHSAAKSGHLDICKYILELVQGGG
jgi:hypothetical protein